MKMHKDYRPLVKAAQKAGWTLELTGTHHNRLVPPEGWTNPAGEPAKPVGFAGTPSDTKRGVKNTRADLKRQGLAL